MGQARIFYDRFWKDEHIKVNPFDIRPRGWTQENFGYHLNFFKLYIGGRLLDFGCGDGQFLSLASQYCTAVHGVDISQVAIEKAKRAYPSFDFRLIEESSTIPYPDNYFDTICLIDVLEHILDTEFILEELNRILRPGGVILIATSELTPIKMILVSMRYLDTYFYPTSPHIRHFTKKNLRDILRRKGFGVINYQKNRTYFGFIPRGQMVVASKMK